MGFRPSSVCSPYSGVAPTIDAARADGPPSRFVRAPRTEFAKQTAFDSAQATCSPSPGRTPIRYGVHEKLGRTPIVAYARAIRACFSAKSGGMPSSFHWAKSVPRGFTVVGTATRASRAKSSRNSRPGSPIILYEAPDTWADVIRTRRSASDRLPRASRICIAFLWDGVPSSRNRRWSRVSRTQTAPWRMDRATRRAISGLAG